MTADQAKRILERPKFGDPQCIEAAQRLRDVELEVQLRAKVIGKKIVCGACGGTSDGCECCDAEGMLLITKQLADSWDLDILEQVQEELKA